MEREREREREKGGGGGDERAVGLRFVNSSTTVKPRYNAGSWVSLATFVRYNGVSLYRGPFSYVLLLLGCVIPRSSL